MPPDLAERAVDVAARVQTLCDGGSIDEGIALAQRTLVGASLDDRPFLQHALASACSVAGRLVDALRAAAAARDGFRARGDRSGELDAITTIGLVMRGAGDHAAAIASFEDAEPVARAIADEMRLGIVLRQIGICCSILGRHQQALSTLGEAEALHARDPDGREAIATRLSLYNAHNRRSASLPAGAAERIAELEAHLDRWLELAADAKRLGMATREVMAIGNHAITLTDLGRSDEALTELTALLPRYRALGMLPNEAICRFEMGRASELLGRHDQARASYLEAIGGFERVGSNGDLREALEGLANVEEAMGRHVEALAALRRVRILESQASDDEARRGASQRELRIELARLSSQWQRLATIDALTGLGNRRALEHWLTDVEARIERGGSMTVLLHDMDHFKRINDTFGHGVGDDVLRRVATLIQGNCRPHDLAVRYGGEEFILALLDIEAGRAVEVAERLRLSVEQDDWVRIAPGLAVTISVGIASTAETIDSSALLTLADRRLYAAKHGGRNRVVYSG